MSLEEIKVIDKIEVMENGTIQVREATRIFKNGEQIAQSYHRWAFPPLSDISSMPLNVQAVAQTVWTEDVVLKYKTQQEESIAEQAAFAATTQGA